jgi:hypothetical protein
MLFDVVIPLGANDINKIDKTVENVKTNVIGYRNIYIVSYDKNINIDGCITIDENIFDFKKDIYDMTFTYNRNGWYLQQLIKLYSSFYIEELLDNYLIIDCDTFFFKKTSFFDENDLPLYNHGEEYHIPYFEHMSKLHPTLNRYKYEISGICHHMMFQKPILKDLFKLVEDYHNNEKPFYKFFLEYIDTNIISSASEYEIYFNYLCIYKQGKFKIRKLNNLNISFSNYDNYVNSEYDYISCHNYI